MGTLVGTVRNIEAAISISVFTGKVLVQGYFLPVGGMAAEVVLAMKGKATRRREKEMSQTRLMVLSKDKLFFCKESDRQHVYDHIPLSEIADVEALSADSFVRDRRRRGTLRRHQSLMHGHTHENLGGSFVTDTAVASSRARTLGELDHASQVRVSARVCTHTSWGRYAG